MQLIDNTVRGLHAFVSRNNRGFKSVKILLVVSLPKQTSTGCEVHRYCKNPFAMEVSAGLTWNLRLLGSIWFGG